MALDPSFIGKQYPPTEPYQVGIEKIREFADAIGEGSPLCHDTDAARAAGYPDVVAPPTFLTVLNLKVIEEIATDPVLGLDYGRMVHGQQRFTHHRPVHAGDALVLVAHIDDIMTRAGNDFLTVRAEVATVHGEPVSTARAQLVVRGDDA